MADPLLSQVQSQSGPAPPTAASQPVDPSQASAAQIPLQNFEIPDFPPQARGLKALTLTSDLKLDEYQDLLSKSFVVPSSLPRGIESLTLELFSLGYPAGFLQDLGRRLPNLKSLVVYSQLLGGISDESQLDAVNLFKALAGLRALHLLDVFARPGFFTQVGRHVTYDPGEATQDGASAIGFRRGLMFLEINYTAQHSDDTFLSRVSATELPAMIGPGLISLALNVSEADVTDDPEDPTNVAGEHAAGAKTDQEKQDADTPQKDGVMTFNKTLAEPLIKELLDEHSRPVNLRVLNLSLYTLTLADAKKVLKAHKGLMILVMTIEAEDPDTCRKGLLEILKGLDKVEQVEIVLSPNLQLFLAINRIPSNALEKAVPSLSDLEEISKQCPKLSSFKANVLRSKSLAFVEWEKKDGKWTGEANPGTRTAERK